jgi:hypothetical protein
VSLAGDVLWEGPPNFLPLEQTHSFSQLSTGNYLLDTELPGTSQDSPQIKDQLLQEIAPDLSVVWSWQLFNHVPKVSPRYELCHGNAVSVDEATNMAYFNCRYLGVFKIDRSSGDIVWRLGGTFDSTTLGPGDFTFDPPEAQFSDVHAPKFYADGRVLVYDNGGFQNLPQGTTYHSRVLEYQLDEVAMTAKRTFEFPGDFPGNDWYKNGWYTPVWGDADRQPNGNILITAGTRLATSATRIIEVTRAGEVVWELTFPKNIGAYRAQRLSPPPLVERLP